MQEVMMVFINGVGGVFAGMALLFLTIKFTAIVADKLSAGKDKK